MNSPFRKIPGSITAPLGFSAAGVFCDIKRLGTGTGSNKGRKLDLGLIVSDAPAKVAGLFTTNQVCAAPVKVCVDRLARGLARAVVVNSGNANACTGERGMRDAVATTDWVAHRLNLPREQILVGSTGRIGVFLPLDKVKQGIDTASKVLGSSRRHGSQVAEAIMTSDTHPKELALELTLGGKKVRLGGISKGAGMIQPGMSATGHRPPARSLHATMLAFLTTDAAVELGALKAALKEAVARSFNRITVDGDMSTNDTVLLLANGRAGNPPLSRKHKADFAKFQAALNHLTLELARMMVRDGEGVTRVVTVKVSGARTADDAESAARAVANSILVKTSWYGGDPNWGRIMDALGYSEARVMEEKVDISYCWPSERGQSKRLFSLRKGRPTSASFKALCGMVARKEFDLEIHLNLGHAATVLYASDLTENYVTFNKGDISDPSAMGG